MAKAALIKAPYQEMEYTEEMIDELRKCMKPVISDDEGPIYFIRKYVHIQHPKAGEIPFDVRDYQIKMIDNYLNNQWAITLTSRQSGKTETSASYLLWKAIFHPDMNILIASRRHSDAKDIMKRIKFQYESLPDWLKPGVTEYNVHTVSFDNGSELYAEATTANTGRGRSISLLYLDEFAFVKPLVAEDFWASILPTLSTGGDCIITSTPNGSEDQFSMLWHGAIAEQNGFSPVEVTWREVPMDAHGKKMRDDKFRADIIAKFGELKWRREYNNEFISSEETLIHGIRLSNLKSTDPILVKNGFKFWEQIQKQKKYIIGVDVGTGTGGDYSTIQVFSFPQLNQVAEFRENTLSTPKFTKKLIWILNVIEKAGSESFYSVENNGVGEGVISAIESYEDANDTELPGVMFHDKGKDKRGFYTSNKAKLRACMDLKTLIDSDRPRMTIRSKVLMTELKFFVRKGASFEAKLGITDDLIMALIIMIRVMQEVLLYDDEEIDTLFDDDDDDDADLDESELYGIVM